MLFGLFLGCHRDEARGERSLRLLDQEIHRFVGVRIQCIVS